MRITIVSMEIPYPPIHGGRVDVWRRIKALSEVGVELQLVCWSKSAPNPEDIAIIQQYVKQLHLIVYNRDFVTSIRRLVDLFSYSLELTSRVVRGQNWHQLKTQVQVFQPDVIMADHVHSTIVASPLSKTLNIPMIVRSHDIEHLHYRYLMKTAKGYRKIVRFLSQNNLEVYEKKMFQESLAFYDISADDLQFWKNRGFTNGYLLPPLIELPKLNENHEQQSEDLQTTETSYDVVFLGNLVAENNVAGVMWFLQDVLPILKKKLPKIKVLIAGSNPVPQIKELCHKLKDNVDLKINPPIASEIYRSGKVLINPIWVGSGVSIKSIDMLAASKPIVSFPKGLVGLPENVKQYFRVAHDADSFTEEVYKCLTTNDYVAAERESLESVLGIGVIQSFINQLNEMIQ